jgi:hypothetical protein
VSRLVQHWFTQASASDVSFDLAGTRQAPACGGHGIEPHRVDRRSAALADAVTITQQALPRVSDIIESTPKVVDQSVTDFPRKGVTGSASRIFTGPSRPSGIVLVGPLVEGDGSELVDRAIQTSLLGVEQGLDSPVGGLVTGVFGSRVHDPNLNPANRLR